MFISPSLCFVCVLERRWKWSLLIYVLGAKRLVPPLLQREESSDAREVCPCEQMWHPLPAVDGWASPQEKGGHRHPQGLRPLEEKLLRFPVHPHPGQEVSWQLLRLQVHCAGILLFSLLRRYGLKICVFLMLKVRIAVFVSYFLKYFYYLYKSISSK